MTIIYRTPGTWGAGKGSNLTATEIDTNFYSLDQRISSIESNPPDPVNISTISIANNQFTMSLEDGTQFGPLFLPTLGLKRRDNWVAEAQYYINDIVFVSRTLASNISNAGFYIVLQNHTAALTFDPDRTISNSKVYCQISGIPYLNQKEILNYSPSSVLKALSFFDYENDTYLALDDILTTSSNDVLAAINNQKVIPVTSTGRLSFQKLADFDDVLLADNFIYVDANGYSLKCGYPKFELLPDGPGSFNGTGERVIRVKQDGTGLEYHALSFLDLNDCPHSFSGANGKYVAINQSNNGLEFVDGPSKTFIGLLDVPSTYSGAANKYVAVNSNGNGLTFVTGPSSSFIGLTDVPASYTGAANKYVTVNSSANGLEFTTKPTYAFTTLTDAPQTYSGSASKYVAVNSSGTGLEFVPQSGASGVSALNYSTTQTPSGVTNAEFLNIPSYVKRINIHFSGMRLSGTADYFFQFGNAGGYVITNYASVYSFLRSSANGSSGSSTAAAFTAYGGGSTNYSHGSCSFILLDSATALWCYSFTGSNVSGSNYFTVHAGGSKSFGASFVPTKLRIISSNGTDTFQSGSTINISYE